MNSYGYTLRNRVEYNTISSVIGSDAEHCGNGILNLGENDRYVRETQIKNNLISNIIGGNYNLGGNGISVFSATDTIISDNTILNCTAGEAAARSANGIIQYWTENSLITRNIIDNCLGYKSYSGNGIFSAYEFYTTCTFNNISNIMTCCAIARTFG